MKYAVQYFTDRTIIDTWARDFENVIDIFKHRRCELVEKIKNKEEFEFVIWKDVGDEDQNMLHYWKEYLRIDLDTEVDTHWRFYKVEKTLINEDFKEK